MKKQTRKRIEKNVRITRHIADSLLIAAEHNTDTRFAAWLRVNGTLLHKQMNELSEALGLPATSEAEAYLLHG